MKALIFDTETTGLISNELLPLEAQPRVIEFFGVIVDDKGKELDRLEFLSNPGFKLDPIITKITGLTDSDLKGEKPFKENWPALKKLFSKANAVVAHNLSFDISILNFEAKRLGEEIPWPNIKICTVEKSEWLKGHRLNLTALHEELFGEPFTGSHRAKEDVLALKRCWIEMRKREWV